MPRAIFKNTFINSTKHYCCVVIPYPFLPLFALIWQEVVVGLLLFQLVEATKYIEFLLKNLKVEGGELCVQVLFWDKSLKMRPNTN